MAENPPTQSLATDLLANLVENVENKLRWSKWQRIGLVATLCVAILVALFAATRPRTLVTIQFPPFSDLKPNVIIVVGSQEYTQEELQQPIAVPLGEWAIQFKIGDEIFEDRKPLHLEVTEDAIRILKEGETKPFKEIPVVPGEVSKIPPLEEVFTVPNELTPPSKRTFQYEESSNTGVAFISPPDGYPKLRYCYVNLADGNVNLGYRTGPGEMDVPPGLCDLWCTWADGKKVLVQRDVPVRHGKRVIVDPSQYVARIQLSDVAGFPRIAKFWLETPGESYDTGAIQSRNGAGVVVVNPGTYELWCSFSNGGKRYTQLTPQFTVKAGDFLSCKLSDFIGQIAIPDEVDYPNIVDFGLYEKGMTNSLQWRSKAGAIGIPEGVYDLWCRFESHKNYVIFRRGLTIEAGQQIQFKPSELGGAIAISNQAGYPKLSKFGAFLRGRNYYSFQYRDGAGRLMLPPGTYNIWCSFDGQKLNPVYRPQITIQPGQRMNLKPSQMAGAIHIVEEVGYPKIDYVYLSHVYYEDQSNPTVYRSSAGPLVVPPGKYHLDIKFSGESPLRVRRDLDLSLGKFVSLRPSDLVGRVTFSNPEHGNPVGRFELRIPGTDKSIRSKDSAGTVHVPPGEYVLWWKDKEGAEHALRKRVPVKAGEDVRRAATVD